MGLYVLEEYVLNGFNASSKARDDVSKLILQFGFQPFAKNDKRNITSSKVKKAMMAVGIYGKMLLKLRKKDTIFLQCSFKILPGILKVKEIKKFKIIYLIHDMFSIQYDNLELHKDEIKSEVGLINQCEFVICHNRIMKEKLIQMGCTSTLVDLGGAFDYLVEDESLPDRKVRENWEVAFAGSISKSNFLKELDKKSSVKFNIYGLPKKEFKYLNYKGSVLPEELPRKIEGNFGLIWEGDYTVTENDNYTRFNNPHKASLYIVSGLPIIAWGKSAIASFIEENGLGIAISSLDEIEDVLSSMSIGDYEKMVKACLVYRSRLINGMQLKSAIDQIKAKL